MTSVHSAGLIMEVDPLRVSRSDRCCDAIASINQFAADPQLEDGDRFPDQLDEY